MKKLILYIGMLAVASSAWAFDATFCKDGGKIVMSISGAKMISFGADKTLVTDDDNVTTVNNSDFDFMSFKGDKGSGVEGVVTDAPALIFRNNVISVEGEADLIEIFSLTGATMIRVNHATECSIESLPAGAYVVRAVTAGKSTVIKIIK